ncbi:MAG TPA: arsenic resistance N-acetyltransferase ArsN2, partial [Pseudomonadales bacterium]|nr:arsenic resistance N-acetyltransferase ArsN2 [Pseudomonadales bacterium]
MTPLRVVVGVPEADGRRLLAEAGLTSEDLAPQAFADFAGCYEGARLVGVAGLERHGTRGLLRSLAVAEDARGRGYGVLLVNAVERMARDAGLEELWLLTETAMGFFSALDYDLVLRERVPAAIRATTQFSDLCPDSAICMMRPLAPAA